MPRPSIHPPAMSGFGVLFESKDRSAHNIKPRWQHGRMYTARRIDRASGVIPGPDFFDRPKIKTARKENAGQFGALDETRQLRRTAPAWHRHRQVSYRAATGRSRALPEMPAVRRLCRHARSGLDRRTPTAIAASGTRSSRCRFSLNLPRCKEPNGSEFVGCSTGGPVWHLPPERATHVTSYLHGQFCSHWQIK